MQQVSRAWEALQPIAPEEGISPYTIRVALAGVSGVLFLLVGISMIIYEAIALGVIPMIGHPFVNDGFSRVSSSGWLGSVFPVIPGILAVYHYVNIRRRLEAGGELEARRASNYARTWSQIALWTWVGLGISWMLFLGILMAAMVLLLLVLLAIVFAVVFAVLYFFFSGALGALGSIFSTGGSGGGGDSDDRTGGKEIDDEKVRRPGERRSRHDARMTWRMEQAEQRERKRRWRW